MPPEQETDEDEILDEYDEKWSNPTGSYYYCLVLPNGDVEYHGTKGAIRKRIDELYVGN